MDNQVFKILGYEYSVLWKAQADACARVGTVGATERLLDGKSGHSPK